MTSVTDWADCRSELLDATNRFAALIESHRFESAPVPGLAWTVGELGAHLVSIPNRYRRMMAAPEPFPESLSAMNDAEIAEIDTRDPTKLALRLRNDVQDLVETFGNDGSREIPFFGMTHTVSGVAGVLIGELLIHGHDLAAAAGNDWRIEPHQARMALRGLLPAAVHSCDPEIARAMDATFHIRIRPDDDWTLRVERGTASITAGRPPTADLHISADPVAYLLVGYGRSGRVRAALTGKIFAYGLKPWLGSNFSRLFRET